MARQELGSIVGGLVGGTLATAAMLKGMALSERMPRAVRPPEMRDPGEYIVERLEERRGRPLSPTAHRRTAHGLHWVYGVGWSSLLAVVAPRLGMHRLGRAAAVGAGFGAAVWAVGFLGWLPRTGLVAPIRQQGLTHHLSALVSHVGYGVLAALPIYVANRTLARC